MAKNQITMNKNIEASIKNLEIQINQLYQQSEAQASSTKRKVETCKALELRSRVIPSIPKIIDEKRTSLRERKLVGKSGS